MIRAAEVGGPNALDRTAAVPKDRCQARRLRISHAPSNGGQACPHSKMNMPEENTDVNIP